MTSRVNPGSKVPKKLRRNARNAASDTITVAYAAAGVGLARFNPRVGWP